MLRKISSMVVVGALFVVLVSTGCQRRPQNYAGIAPNKGNPASAESIDPHKKYGGQ